MKHPWIAAFFAFGAMMCALTVSLLLFPGTPLDLAWSLNPTAHRSFGLYPVFGVLLMLLVGAGCAGAAIGLWRGTRWGMRLALVILALNLCGDLINTLVRKDYRALIGLPIGGAMMIWLLRPSARKTQEKRNFT